MAALTSPSSSLLFTSPSASNLSPRNSISLPSRLSLLSASSSHSLLSSSFSISPISFLPYPTLSGSRKASLSSSFTVKASGAPEKKKVLIVNTNSGGHAVIGFYFAKELLGSGHEVTILTVGDEGSAKMKKPPFNRFKEIVSGGGKTVWGDSAEIGKILEEGSSFDVVLDNNGKDLETVRLLLALRKGMGVGVISSMFCEAYPFQLPRSLLSLLRHVKPTFNFNCTAYFFPLSSALKPPTSLLNLRPFPNFLTNAHFRSTPFFRKSFSNFAPTPRQGVDCSQIISRAAGV